MKKDTNSFVKDGIYISIEGKQYNFKGVLFEKLIFDAYTQNNLEEFLQDIYTKYNQSKNYGYQLWILYSLNIWMVNNG